VRGLNQDAIFLIAVESSANQEFERAAHWSMLRFGNTLNLPLEICRKPKRSDRVFGHVAMIGY